MEYSSTSFEHSIETLKEEIKTVQTEKLFESRDELKFIALFLQCPSPTSVQLSAEI